MSGTERFGGPGRSGGAGGTGAVALHDRTVDRLLAGTLGPEDVPPVYEQVAQVVRAAAGPPTPEEFGEEEAAVALLVHTVAAAPGVAPVPGVAQTPALAAATPAPRRPVAVVLSSVSARETVTSRSLPRWWERRGTRVAAVAVALLFGAGGALAGLGGGGSRPPTISAERVPGFERSATIQGTHGPPVSEPAPAVPTTVARPPATAPPATSAPLPPVAAVPVAPAPNTPPAPVAPPPATGTPPTTAPPLPEECADVDRLPAGMREGLDRMARGFGFPSFAEMCRVGAQYSAGSGAGTGASQWWSGSSPRRR